MIEEIVPFYTSIYCDTLSYDVVDLSKNIKNIQQYEESVSKSNRLGWQSNVYKESHVFMKDLILNIEDILKPIYYNIGLDKEPKMACYWFNVNNKYSYNLSHSHAGCYFSAAYYVKVPSDSGKIVFERPDLLNSWIVSDRLTDRNWAVYSLPPRENFLVIFPSYLRHYVESNLTSDEDSDRISIAFNFK
jgi:uncharacterized protein (TIGR02466 family)